MANEIKNISSYDNIDDISNMKALLHINQSNKTDLVEAEKVSCIGNHFESLKGLFSCYDGFLDIITENDALAPKTVKTYSNSLSGLEPGMVHIAYRFIDEVGEAIKPGLSHISIPISGSIMDYSTYVCDVFDKGDSKIIVIARPTSYGFSLECGLVGIETIYEVKLSELTKGTDQWGTVYYKNFDAPPDNIIDGQEYLVKVGKDKFDTNIIGGIMYAPEISGYVWGVQNPDDNVYLYYGAGTKDDQYALDKGHIELSIYDENTSTTLEADDCITISRIRELQPIEVELVNVYYQPINNFDNRDIQEEL